MILWYIDLKNNFGKKYLADWIAVDIAVVDVVAVAVGTARSCRKSFSERSESCQFRSGNCSGLEVHL